ncbi:MAG: hypothetical protein M3Q75_05595 [Gemmatimonadota bacterium]|nr:hypothetical protein [Gemmatimonadota bacterium]
MTQVARNFCAELEEVGRRVKFLIRDRDTKFSSTFDNVFASVGAETILTLVHSPKANAVAERWVRTVREDCLDHLLVPSCGVPEVGRSCDLGERGNPRDQDDRASCRYVCST